MPLLSKYYIESKVFMDERLMAGQTSHLKSVFEIAETYVVRGV